MTLEEEFEKHYKDWQTHCDVDCFFSTVIEDYTDCDAYRKLVELGKPILHFVHKKSREKRDLTLGLLIEGIVGNDFKIDFSARDLFKKNYNTQEHMSELFDDHDKIHKNTIKWLDENIEKYNA